MSTPCVINLDLADVWDSRGRKSLRRTLAWGDEITVTDPALYAGPQRRTVYFQRMADTATLEYACSAEHWLEALEKNRASQ